MKKLDPKRFFARFTAKKKKKKGLDPSRDWKYAVILFCVLALFVLMYGGYNYWKIKQGTFFKKGDSNVSVKAALNTKTLQKTIDSFNTKDQSFQDLKKNKPNVADPSL